MDIGRKTKIEEQIREVAASIIERESNKTALITVTSVVLDDRARTGKILLSVLPVDGEESALHFVKRLRPEIRDEVKRRLNLGTIPFLDVAIDTGEKARQTIDALLKEGE